MLRQTHDRAVPLFDHFLQVRGVAMTPVKVEEALEKVLEKLQG